jgi:hypothetical protein
MNRNLDVRLNVHAPSFFWKAPARVHVFPFMETSTTAFKSRHSPFESPEWRETLPVVGLESSTIHQSPAENPPFGM